ncbi:Mu transposase C-terminal domain-containing protein [Spirillospora sp. NPDC052269]
MAHPDRQRWQVTLLRLHDLRAQGALTPQHLRLAAAGLGVTVRTVRRRLTAFTPDAAVLRRGPDPYRLSRTDLDAYAFYRGNIAFVFRARQAVLEGSGTVAGGPVPAFLARGWADAEPVALRSLQRAFAEQTSSGYRALLTHGENARREHGVHCDQPEVPRNTVWETDHKDLPILVLPPRGKAARPWLTAFTDARTRAIVGWCLALRPSSATVLTALRMALVHEPDRGPWGAVPAAVRIDGGLEFAATAVQDALNSLSVTCDLLPPRTPELKGKQERLHRTVQQTLLTGLPGYTDGPRDAAGQLYGPLKDDPRSREDAQTAPTRPMRIERLAARMATWVHWYNTERPHGALDGRTPLQAWTDDDTALHRVPADTLRHLLLAGDDRVIQKDGVHFRGLNFIAPELDGKAGERISIRYMPHEDRWIEVYQFGEHLCTAYPQGHLTPEQHQAFRDHKRAEARHLRRELRRAERHAREVLAPLNDDQPHAVDTRLIPAHHAAQTTRPAPRPRNRSDRLLAEQASTSLLGLHPPAGLPNTEPPAAAPALAPAPAEPGGPPTDPSTDPPSTDRRAGPDPEPEPEAR